LDYYIHLLRRGTVTYTKIEDEISSFILSISYAKPSDILYGWLFSDQVNVDRNIKMLMMVK